MSLVEHAIRELELSGQTVEDPAYAATLVATVAAFASYGHSGGSAGVAVEQLGRLLRFEPLTPITADPAEWIDRSKMSGRPMWQNLRDSRAMSEDGGQTWWYVEGRHPGERCCDGGVWGVLVRCLTCGGEGLLHQPDEPPGTGPGPVAEEMPAGPGAVMVVETEVDAETGVFQHG